MGRRLAREKLYDLARRVMKSAAEMTEAEAQLDLGLDVADFTMPGMIAVPVDPCNPLNGECEWVPVMHGRILSASTKSSTRALGPWRLRSAETRTFVSMTTRVI
jgi:hypothetical protein